MKIHMKITEPELGKFSATSLAETKMPEPIMIPKNRLTVFQRPTFRSTTTRFSGFEFSDILKM